MASYQGINLIEYKSHKAVTFLRVNFNRVKHQVRYAAREIKMVSYLIDVLRIYLQIFFCMALERDITKVVMCFGKKTDSFKGNRLRMCLLNNDEVIESCFVVTFIYYICDSLFVGVLVYMAALHKTISIHELG